MRPLICGTLEVLTEVFLGVLLAICLVTAVDAQENSQENSRQNARQISPEQPTPDAASSPTTLTGKERLGRKWMDEQRIDNCNVPVDNRGSRPRPSTCPHVPMS